MKSFLPNGVLLVLASAVAAAAVVVALSLVIGAFGKHRSARTLRRRALIMVALGATYVVLRLALH